jgi:hypothetical protein
MGKKHFTIIILVTCSLVILMIIVGCTDSFNPRLFSSKYKYDIQIQSDSPLHNVTFFIPVPVKDGIPTAGNQNLTADDFRQPGISVTLNQSPPGLDLTGAALLHNYNPWFVVIRADELAPMNGSSAVYGIQKDFFVQHSRLANYRIVPNPVGSESLIVPKFNFTWKDPQVKEVQKYIIRYKPYQVPQQTLIFADYQTSPSAQVKISFSYSGENHWREAYDDTYINSYQESFSGQFNGEKHGWYSVPGVIQSKPFPGESQSYAFEEYPNMTSPKWQEVLNQTLS